MSRAIAAALCLSLAAGPAASAAEPSWFEWRAPVEGEIQADHPVRVDLPADVLAATDASADLRLFDERDREVPFVIYEHKAPARLKEAVALKVVGYAEAGTGQYVLLEVPEDAGPIDRLRVTTPERDFAATLTLSASGERLPLDDSRWQAVTQDALFDYSSRVDLRRTEIPLATPVTARYLRVGLDVEEGGSRGVARVHRDADSLFFSFRRASAHRLKISAFTALRAPDTPPERRYDTRRITGLSGRTDAGVTRIPLGRLNLPGDWLELDIATGFFYRTVEVWTAQEDAPGRWQRRGSEVVYRVPDMPRPQARIDVSFPEAPFIELRVLDGDNPPLEITSATLGWLRRSLYFIPEQGHTYAALFGAEDVSRPSYDTFHILPPTPGQLDSYPSLTLGPRGPNPRFDPAARIDPEPARARAERYLFIAVILALVAGMAVWGIRLMKAASQPPGEPPAAA